MLKSNLYFTPMFATCESKESKEIPEEALRNLHQGDHHGDHESDQGDNNGDDQGDDDENLASEILLNKLDRQGLRARACSKLKMMRRRGGGG